MALLHTRKKRPNMDGDVVLYGKTRPLTALSFAVLTRSFAVLQEQWHRPKGIIMTEKSSIWISNSLIPLEKETQSTEFDNITPRSFSWREVQKSNFTKTLLESCKRLLWSCACACAYAWPAKLTKPLNVDSQSSSVKIGIDSFTVSTKSHTVNQQVIPPPSISTSSIKSHGTDWAASKVYAHNSSNIHLHIGFIDTNLSRLYCSCSPLQHLLIFAPKCLSLN